MAGSEDHQFSTSCSKAGPACLTTSVVSRLGRDFGDSSVTDREQTEVKDTGCHSVVILITVHHPAKW